MGVEFCKLAFSPHYITFDRDVDDNDHKHLQSVISLFPWGILDLSTSGSWSLPTFCSRMAFPPPQIPYSPCWRPWRGSTRRKSTALWSVRERCTSRSCSSSASSSVLKNPPTSRTPQTCWAEPQLLPQQHLPAPTDEYDAGARTGEQHWPSYMRTVCVYNPTYILCVYVYCILNENEVR